MTDEKRRPRPATQYGPTAVAVAQNVKRLREVRNLTIYALSGALGAAGRPITPSAVAKIEKQQRQVTVDDLAALATVFNVSPAALLLPFTERGTDPVEVTGGGTVDASDAWKWAQGQRPFRLTPGNAQTELLEFQLYGLPQWLRSADVAQVNSMLRNAGFPVDEWLLKQGLIEREGNTDGPSVD